LYHQRRILDDGQLLFVANSHKTKSAHAEVIVQGKYVIKLDLVQAEEYTKRNNELASRIISERFQVDAQDMQVFWPNHRFEVALPQALLIAMEDEARWRIENNLTAATEIPSYLDYIYLDALEEVKPEAVTIIR
ncbi:hypothetical protein LCGC14_2553500, partial [marine sediment metagenome]